MFKLLLEKNTQKGGERRGERGGVEREERKRDVDPLWSSSVWWLDNPFGKESRNRWGFRKRGGRRVKSRGVERDEMIDRERDGGRRPSVSLS